MPTIGNAHFAIDLQTLFAVLVFLSAIGGLLLLFCWMQNRNTPALAFWGSGYLLGAIAAALLGSGGPANVWVICISNALLCGAYGVMWGGSRSFEGRRVRAPLIVAGAAIWIAAFQLESFRASPPSCVGLVSFTLAAYALLSARELWYARDRELISRWPTLALVVTHAGFLLARIPFASVVASSAAAGQPHSAVVLVMAAEALFVNFRLPFLRVAMSKERAELEQRKAALTDPLTGVANRRAFFDLGERLLARTIADRRPAALLLFDLDRFKEVNDYRGARGRRRPAAGVRTPRRRFGASGRPVQQRRRRGIRLPLAERLDGRGAADRRAIARGFRADALSGRGALRHRERRHRHDDRRMPGPAGPDGNRRSGALSCQGRRAQPRRPGAAGDA